jgi:cytochrome o ubiquinol oxidase subunit 3
MKKAVPMPAKAIVPVSERGPASARVVVGFGFWLFLLSDIIIFGSLFAAYAVLSGEVAGGPSGPQLFDRGHVLIETCLLLMSSITCGFMALAMERKVKLETYLWAAATAGLGVVFLWLEVSEFAGMVARGATPQTSAFLSAFFALVGTHGLHVFSGLLWLAAMLAQIATLGFQSMVVRRMLCFSLFWHALDIVWVGVFTIVYLGAH